jgi:hypothetical protein
LLLLLLLKFNKKAWMKKPAMKPAKRRPGEKACINILPRFRRAERANRGAGASDCDGFQYFSQICQGKQENQYFS